MIYEDSCTAGVSRPAAAAPAAAAAATVWKGGEPSIPMATDASGGAHIAVFACSRTDRKLQLT